MPKPSATATHRTDPALLKATNLVQPMRMAPAMGGAMIASPGTNLAITSALTPQRSNRVWVSLTQESGSSEIRHSVFNTRIP
jgi:hypothetical protein